MKQNAHILKGTLIVTHFFVVVKSFSQPFYDFLKIFSPLVLSPSGEIFCMKKPLSHFFYPFSVTIFQKSKIFSTIVNQIVN